MKKSLLIYLLTIAFNLPLMADDMRQLVVWAKDGTKVAFALEERPQITFTETELVITTNKENHYALENVAKFTYEQIPSGIKNLLNDNPVFILNGESLLFPSLKTGNTVSVTSPNGTSIFRKTVKSDGEYAFPIDNLQHGVYLVTVNGLTYKIVKK